MPDPLIGQTLANEYDVLRAIGSGGVGVVYLARQRGLDRDVAIKVIRRELANHPQVLLRFENEAKVVSRLRHPNTIRVLDTGTTDRGERFIVTELLTGRSLAQELAAGPLALDRVCRIAEQVSSSLTEAHSYGIIHRDIKPGNIFLDEIGGAKVLDFGAAKLTDGVGITAPDAFVGTIHYLSPEHVNQNVLDHRSDLYSLGVTMYEMVAGRLPFPSDKILEVFNGHMYQAPPPIRTFRPDAPSALVELIDSMLAKDPASRPQSADEVRRALLRIGEEDGTVAGFDSQEFTVSPATQLIVPAPPRRVALIKLAIAGVVAFASAAVLIASFGVEPPPTLDRAEVRVPAVASPTSCELVDTAETIVVDHPPEPILVSPEPILAIPEPILVSPKTILVSPETILVSDHSSRTVPRVERSADEAARRADSTLARPPKPRPLPVSFE